jgi:hypothetical protein
VNAFSLKSILWRVALGLLSLLILWRVVTLGLAEHFAADLGDDEPATAERVLTWNPEHVPALIDHAYRLLADDPVRARAVATRASIADPGNPMALILSAQASRRIGDLAQADALAEQALRLAPTRVPVLLQLVDYWAARDRLERTLAVMGVALTARPDLGATLYPRLLRVAEEPALRSAFAPLTQRPPPWWDAFYAHVADRALTLDTVAVLTTMRRESSVPLSQSERRAAVSRLLREGEWSAAYLMWVNGLSAEQRGHLGSVYNGDFELPLGSDGFDWVARPVKGVSVARRKTFGIRGEKALHLVFGGREFAFDHLSQRLFLAPGDYEFFTDVRPDRLQGRGGLQWVVQCSGPETAELGFSDRFLGTSEWRRADFRFTVPPMRCEGQTLRLKSGGKRLFDHKLAGEVWFDRVGIKRVRGIKLIPEQPKH